MRKPNSATTRRLVNYLLHPHPTPVYPRLKTTCRYRQLCRRSLAENYDPLPESSSTRADPNVALATQAFVARFSTQISRPDSLIACQENAYTGREHAFDDLNELPSSPGRRLRSYRAMKHRSIRDSTVALEMRRRVCTASFSNVTPGRSLRRMPRITPCHARVLEGFPPQGNDYLDDEFSPPDQASTDSSQENSGSVMYFTAKSAFSEPSEEYQQTILQVLDTESGVFFDKVCQGSKGTLKVEQLAPEMFDDQHAVTVKIDSPGRLRRNFASDHLVGMVAPPVPSLMLTLPTPQLPGSPIFVPTSPITVTKFITAAAQPSNLVPQPLQASRPVPVMQFCEDCVLAPPDSGFLCHSCDQQWLACKVWYQANDGGRRQRLTEPYIKPAESTAANRALIDFLRAPTGSGNSYGLGIRAAPEVVSRSRFRKLAPLLAMATAESSMSVIYREEVLPLARRMLSVVDLRVLAVLPRKLWAVLVNILSYNVQLLVHFLNALAELNLRVGYDVPSVSEYLWMMTEESMDDTRLLERATRTTSRFLEHLSN